MKCTVYETYIINDVISVLRGTSDEVADALDAIDTGEPLPDIWQILTNSCAAMTNTAAILKVHGIEE